MSTKTAMPVDRNVVIESEDDPIQSTWKPEWMIEMGDSDALGLAIDDGCFVVLYRHGSTWRPGTHIPKEAAERIAKLITAGALN
jgi:hypothetical protein